MEEKDDLEVRFAWYGGLVVTSKQIEMLKFDLEMQDHFRRQREEHKLLIYALKLRTATIRWYNPFSWF